MGQTDKHEVLNRMFVNHGKRMIIPSYYNRDSKAQKKDQQIYSKKMQKHHNWIGVFILLKT